GFALDPCFDFKIERSAPIQDCSGCVLPYHFSHRKPRRSMSSHVAPLFHLRRLLGVALSSLLGLQLTVGLQAQSSAGASVATGTISGSVGSATTHNMLQGAVVEIPALRRQTTTDSSGHFLLAGVPTGAAELAISFGEFEPKRQTVNVTAGAVERVAVELR